MFERYANLTIGIAYIECDDSLDVILYTDRGMFFQNNIIAYGGNNYLCMTQRIKEKKFNRHLQDMPSDYAVNAILSSCIALFVEIKGQFKSVRNAKVYEAFKQKYDGNNIDYNAYMLNFAERVERLTLLDLINASMKAIGINITGRKADGDMIELVHNIGNQDEEVVALINTIH